MVSDKKVSRLDAVLIARTAVGGWTYPDAFAAIRATLHDVAGTQTDDALRGRLTRARQAVGRALNRDEQINDVPGAHTSRHPTPRTGATTTPPWPHQPSARQISGPGDQHPISSAV